MGRQDFIGKFYYFMENSTGMLPFVQAVYMRLLYEWMIEGNEWSVIDLRTFAYAIGEHGQKALGNAIMTLLQRGFIRRKVIDKNTIEVKIQ